MKISYWNALRFRIALGVLLFTNSYLDVNKIIKTNQHQHYKQL